MHPVAHLPRTREALWPKVGRVRHGREHDARAREVAA